MCDEPATSKLDYCILMLLLWFNELSGLAELKLNKRLCKRSTRAAEYPLRQPWLQVGELLFDVVTRPKIFESLTRCLPAPDDPAGAHLRELLRIALAELTEINVCSDHHVISGVCPILQIDSSECSSKVRIWSDTRLTSQKHDESGYLGWMT